jgi:hypothetical protein
MGLGDPGEKGMDPGSESATLNLANKLPGRPDIFRLERGENLDSNF